MTLNSVQILAVTKAVEAKLAKNAREEVLPGEHEVHILAEIRGTLRVGADYEQRIPNKAKPWNLLVVLMREINEMRASAGQVGLDLGKLVEMAEVVDEKLADKAQEDADVAAAKIKSTTVTPCKGKVTAELALTEMTYSGDGPCPLCGAPESIV